MENGDGDFFRHIFGGGGRLFYGSSLVSFLLYGIFTHVDVWSILSWTGIIKTILGIVGSTIVGMITTLLRSKGILLVNRYLNRKKEKNERQEPEEDDYAA